jgi:membrane-associated protease RseP (regulator of RpoE activity)
MTNLGLCCILSTLSVVAFAHDGGGVEAVLPGGAAAAAGLRAGDRIVAIAGQPLATRTDLRRVIDGHKPGDTVPLVVERNGEAVTLRLTFGARADGGAALGVALRHEEAAGAPVGPSDPDSATARCRASNRRRVASRSAPTWST